MQNVLILDMSGNWQDFGISQDTSDVVSKYDPRFFFFGKVWNKKETFKLNRCCCLNNILNYDYKNDLHLLNVESYFLSFNQKYSLTLDQNHLT